MTPTNTITRTLNSSNHHLSLRLASIDESLGNFRVNTPSFTRSSTILLHIILVGIASFIDINTTPAWIPLLHLNIFISSCSSQLSNNIVFVDSRINIISLFTSNFSANASHSATSFTLLPFLLFSCANHRSPHHRASLNLRIVIVFVQRAAEFCVLRIAILVDHRCEPFLLAHLCPDIVDQTSAHPSRIQVIEPIS